MAYIQVWRDPSDKLYRWHIKASNNRVMAQGDEGYHNLGDLWHGVSEVRKALGLALEKPLPIHDRKPEP